MKFKLEVGSELALLPYPVLKAKRSLGPLQYGLLPQSPSSMNIPLLI